MRPCQIKAEMIYLKKKKIHNDLFIDYKQIVEKPKLHKRPHAILNMIQHKKRKENGI